MKDSERASCADNNVYDIREIKIGYDGIVIANSKGAPRFSLSKKDLYLALAHDLPSTADPEKLVANPYRSWHEIDPSLPQQPIRVLGPPPTSGTRDILVERLLQSACQEMLSADIRQDWSTTQLNQHCRALREDGAFVNAGENDARLVRKLINDPETLGIFGYSFLDKNRDRLQAASIGGIEPRFELIESGIYALSRPLYVYVKPRHSTMLADLNAFIDELVSVQASGPDGYLIDHGLIPLPAPERELRDSNIGIRGHQADD
jgi:phosphate transport system substrate-binding protein